MRVLHVPPDDESAAELQYMLDAQAEFTKELVLMAYQKVLLAWDWNDRLIRMVCAIAKLFLWLPDQPVRELEYKTGACDFDMGIAVCI